MKTQIFLVTRDENGRETIEQYGKLETFLAAVFELKRTRRPFKAYEAELIQHDDGE